MSKRTQFAVAVIGTIASLLGVFAFVTGIPSLPSVRMELAKSRASAPSQPKPSQGRPPNSRTERSNDLYVLPRPERLVTDAAGILSSQELASLEADLVDVEKRGLAQMLIYIVPSLPPDEILEDLTLRSAAAWEVGRADVDDGLVIFVFVADRKVRIELGLGLDSAISNEVAARVIAENIAPPFRRAAYGEGLRSAVQELSRLLALSPARTSSQPEAGGA